MRPVVPWPILDEDDQDVEEFFKEFEYTTGLGDGMTQSELFVALRTCLSGTKRQMYDHVKSSRTEDGTIMLENGSLMYAEIKARLMRFTKTHEEKQTAVLDEWQRLMKGKLTALQFEVPWQKLTSKLVTLDLGRQPQELLLSYYAKVGKTLAGAIKKDRRNYPSKPGNLEKQRIVELRHGRKRIWWPWNWKKTSQHCKEHSTGCFR